MPVHFLALVGAIVPEVIGTAVSTLKHASLSSHKLLVTQPLKADGQTADGDPLIAVDTVGAGPGERVIMSSDGKYAREFLRVNATPARWTVIGIDDRAT